MLVLPNQRLCWVFSTSDQCFVSFQPIWCHPHTQIRIVLFPDEQRDIPNWKPSHNRISIGFSQIAFPITVLPKDDQINFVQEEQLGLPYWIMILAICVVEDESKCLDIPILEFSIISEHLPFLLGCKQILRPLLVLRNLAVWRWYPWPLRPSFVMLMILVQWILHKTLNHLSQCHLGVRLDLCIFGALSPSRHSSNNRYPSVRQNELLCPSSLLHRSTLICFWLLLCPTPESFQNFPFFISCCFCYRYLHCLRHRNKFMYQLVML